MLKPRLNIPIELILYAWKVDAIQELAILSTLKARFKSSHLHSRSNKYLDKLPVASRERVRRALTWGRKVGIVKDLPKGFILHNFRKAHKFYEADKKPKCKNRGNSRTPMSKVWYATTTVSEFEKNLKAILLRDDQRKADFVHKNYDPHIQKSQPFRKGENSTGALDYRGFAVSYKAIARTWNCSVTSAFYLVKQLQKEGVLAKKNNTINTGVGNVFLTTIQENSPGVYYAGKDGHIRKQLPNGYIFWDLPKSSPLLKSIYSPKLSDFGSFVITASKKREEEEDDQAVYKELAKVMQEEQITPNSYQSRRVLTYNPDLDENLPF